MKRLKYAEQKIFRICIEVYHFYESNDYDKKCEVLYTLKKKKLKINNILIEKPKDMLENPDFEQNRYSMTSKGVYKSAHDSLRLMKRICYHD